MELLEERNNENTLGQDLNKSNKEKKSSHWLEKRKCGDTELKEGDTSNHLLYDPRRN